MLDAKSQAKVLKETWDSDSRWKDVLRPYEAEDVVKLRGSVQIEHTLAKRGAEKLWNLINTEDFVPVLGGPDRRASGTTSEGWNKSNLSVRLASRS